ncbi:hypothetical protein PVAP13_7NG069700 [Panicum virgatum]|uniref:Uncharacterized protein n=1 Tax=Panicum virgatum TaxID=38727 RepID=A0A8T0PVX3_PANVG|nr:hypothetical protein PVAP13_7NG069700 [Panicum virgatum]
MVVMKTNMLDQLSRFVRFIKWRRLFALQSSAKHERGELYTLESDDE